MIIHSGIQSSLYILCKCICCHCNNRDLLSVRTVRKISYCFCRCISIHFRHHNIHQNTRDKLTNALHTICGFETDYRFITKRQMKNILKKKQRSEIKYYIPKRHNKSPNPSKIKMYIVFLFRNCQRQDISS